MTITRAEIDDLNDGDMVTVAGWHGLCISGPVTVDGDGVWMGEMIPLAYRDAEGVPPWAQEFGSTLQIISRAEPPMYVNHPRTKAAPGDVVRDADGDGIDVWFRYQFNSGECSWCNLRTQVRGRHELPTRLRLLVDGETGQVVK